MSHQRIVADEIQELVHDLGETRLALQIGPGEAVHPGCIRIDVALRIDQAVEHQPGRQVTHQLERRNFDHPIPGERVEPRGLRVEQDRTAHGRNDRISRRNGRRAALRDSPVWTTRSARRRFCESGI